MSDYYEDMVERFFSAHVLHMEEHSNLTKYAWSPARDSVWVCKDGTEVKVRDMSLHHLKNALSMLLRKGVKDHPFVKIFRWEIHLREDYSKLKETIAHEDNVIRMCF